MDAFPLDLVAVLALVTLEGRRLGLDPGGRLVCLEQRVKRNGLICPEYAAHVKHGGSGFICHGHHIISGGQYKNFKTIN